METERDGRSEQLSTEEKARIDEMSREDMAQLRRFAPAGHPYFVRGTPAQEYFEERYNRLGGMSPGISKRIGWG